jgi:uncharacterized protein (DUF885 family)
MFKRYLVRDNMNNKLVITTLVCSILYGCGLDNKTEQALVQNKQSGTESKQINKTKVIERAEIDQLILKHTKTFMALQPTLSTSLNLDKKEFGNYASRVPDYSTEGMQQLQKSMKASIAELDKIDTSHLSDKDRLHINVNRVIDEYFAGDSQFTGGYIDTWGGHLPFIVNQISGPLIDIPTILKDQHSIKSAEDADNYLLRLASLEVMTNQVLSKVKDDEKQGIILPKQLFPKTLGILKGFTAMKASEHALVSSLSTKLSRIDSIPLNKKKEYITKATEIVTSKIFPAYQKVASYMQTLQDKAREEDGIWSQPGGEAFYQHSIKYLGDSSLSADQIHQVGLDEVARITAEMDLILKANGKTTGSVGERMLSLNDEPRFLYEDSDEGRAKLLASLNKEIDIIMKKAPLLFDSLPKQKAVVKRVPIMIEQGASGGSYTPPALDGSRPGTYFINLYDMKSNPSFGLKTLTYHEAVPGHHFQIALNMEQTDIGIMRQNGQFNAFVEGWALYSELLAKEINMYEGDPWGDLGRLQGELYRAARLVVDTGLHSKKWDYEKTVAYFSMATGTPVSDSKNAINRYIAWPGQALGYKIGMLKIVELREWAKTQLGDKFDIKAFHDLVLLPGSRPLSILEDDVKRWVKSSI